MPFSATDVLLGFVLPAVFAGGMFAVLSRSSREGLAGRFAPSVAFICGFVLGYFCLKLGSPVPNRHWHWLPYVLLVPLVLGPVSAASGITLVERVLLYALVSAIAFGFLVPTWDNLEPSRLTQWIFSAGMVVLLACLLEPLSMKFRGSLLALALFIATVFGAGVLFLSGSLRFAQIAGAGAGALLGLSAACRFDGEAVPIRGLAIAWVLFAWGILLVGRTDSFSDVPLASYLLIPVSPLSLWLVTIGPLSRLKGIKQLLVSLGLPLAISLAAIAFAAVAEL
jgi:hypothetical protein